MAPLTSNPSDFNAAVTSQTYYYEQFEVSQLSDMLYQNPGIILSQHKRQEVDNYRQQKLQF